MARYETEKTYKGDSEGIQKLIDGMYEYGEEINLRRAFPDIRDGFKVVQRRILYAVLSSSAFWKAELNKSALLIGEAIKLHPHGDGAIYDVMARLTCNTDYLALAPLKGGGSWGAKLSGEKAAAFRYTNFGVTEYLRHYRKEFLNGVSYTEGELMDGSLEPEYLSIPFPNILANESKGIGYGLASKIPSYNIGELADLTIKLISNGKLAPTDVIHPDFTSGGFLVADAAVASKIMLNGVGTYRTRAKVGIEGSDIKVFEVPAGLNLNTIKDKLTKIIKDEQVPDIKSFQDAQGYSKNKSADNKSILNIYCKRGTAEKVLNELYARNVLENYYTFNIIVNKGNRIIMGGVHKILKEWVEFRKSHLEARYKVQIDEFKDELTVLEVFLALVNDVPSKKEYLRLLTEVGRRDADAYLRELFPGVSDSTVTWVRGRTAESFRDGASYKNRYDDIVATLNEYKENLSDLNKVLIREITDFKNRFGRERRTQLTTNAYSFKKLKAQGGTAVRPKLVDDSKAYYAFTADGFIFKSRRVITQVEEDNLVASFEAKANTNFLAFDNNGRLYRIFSEELPYTEGTTGTYIYRYAGVDPEENSQIMYACPNDGKARHILLHSGNFMVFDTKHHETVQKIRYKNRAVNTAVATEGIAHIFEPGTLPKNLMIIDENTSSSGKVTNRVGILETNTLREAKTSNTKIKAFNQSIKSIFGYVDVPDEWYAGNVWLDNEILRSYFQSGTIRKLPGYREVTEAMAEDFNFINNLIVL